LVNIPKVFGLVTDVTVTVIAPPEQFAPNPGTQSVTLVCNPAQHTYVKLCSAIILLKLN